MVRRTKDLLRNIPRRDAVSKACNATRTAEWLKTPYEANRWIVCDGDDKENTRVIDFAFTMPGGKTLLDFPDLLSSVKEFVFFCRSEQFKLTNDAEVHASFALTAMTLAHGIALDGLTSFQAVNREYTRVFLERLRNLGEHIMRCDERILKWLDQHKALSVDELRELLPIDGYGNAWKLKVIEFLTQLGLPRGTYNFVRSAHLINVVRTRAGLYRAEDSTVEAIPPRPQATKTAIQRCLYTLEMIYFMRNVMDAPAISERPFESGSKALSNRYGKDTEPTPLPPPNVALHLMSQAMVWVKNYSVDLIALLEAAKKVPPKERTYKTPAADKYSEELLKLPQSGPAGCPWPLSARSIHDDIHSISAHTAIRLLMVACMIVIATFSARRLEELEGIEEGDIEIRAGQWWLRAYIQKTIQGKEWIPTAEVVSQAIGVLTRISADARKVTGTKSLCQWISPFFTEDKLITDIYANRILNEFACHVGTPRVSSADGTLAVWDWSSHQFRKFFAVLYFYRYRGATIDDLAYFLRHLDLEMTKKYLLVLPQQVDDFKKIESQCMRNIAKEILEGKAGKIGAGKELRTRLERHFHRGVRPSSPTQEEATEFLARQMKLRRWVIRPRSWGDCTCPSSVGGAKSAKCRRGEASPNDVGPDFASSAPIVCGGCSHILDNGRLEENVEMERLGYKSLATGDIFSGTIVQGIAEAKLIAFHRFEGRAND